MQSSDRISAHYQGDRGQAYTSFYQSDAFHKGHRLNFEYFAPYIHPTDTALDFGCGNGGMLRLLAEQVYEAQGLEVNPHSAKLARASGCIVYSALSDLPSEPVFDVVVSNHVLEHVRDVPSTLERVREAVKPSGRLLLKLPLDDWRAPEQQRWQEADINHHLHTWTPLLIANTLRESGFEVDDVRLVVSAWHQRLFDLDRLGLDRLAFHLVARLKKRRQLFVRARVPAA